MWNTFWAIVGVAGSLAGVALIVYLQASGTPERDAEERARAHFDETGSWPEAEDERI